MLIKLPVGDIAYYLCSFNGNITMYICTHFLTKAWILRAECIVLIVIHY
jgi:hypothetical protein